MCFIYTSNLIKLKTNIVRKASFCVFRLSKNFSETLSRRVFSRKNHNTMMMMMMMMHCFCGMVDRRKVFRLISSRDHCQRSSPLRISNTPRAGFEPSQSLNSGSVEWSCAVVITTTPRRNMRQYSRHKMVADLRTWKLISDKRLKTFRKLVWNMPITWKYTFKMKEIIAVDVPWNI